MMEIFLLLLAGLYLGWNIGANDSANCAGTSVGSRLISYRRATILVAIFALLGAWIGGSRVVETVGKGIISQELTSWTILIAMISAGLCVTLATFFRLPVSTSQAIVGGMTGLGLAVGAEVNFSLIVRIVEAWVFSPILAAASSFFLYHLVALPLRLIRRVGLLDRLLNWLVAFSVGYAAFSLGANNIGNAIGPLANLGLRSPGITLLGGIALAIGVLTYGHRVTETVAHRITPLDPLSAFAAQTSLALVAHLFALIGIPISLSQAVVGALLGVGVAKGMQVVGWERIMLIVLGWVATPAAAGLLAFGWVKLLA
jgi:PiT family inorganic phosphate transporter